jgi:predicted enzyme related to lactoylglutathione lyase
MDSRWRAIGEKKLAVRSQARYCDMGRRWPGARRAEHHLREGGTTVSFGIQHAHVRTRDPKPTMQFYVGNLGVQFVAEIPGRGYRVNLHGLTLNITTLISSQKHEQHYGIEHIVVDTDDYSGTMARLKDNGVRILEEMPPNPDNGRRVCFLKRRMVRRSS